MAENILLDHLPETVYVDGILYEIDTDFRTCIILDKVMNDPDIPSSKEKLEAIVDLFYYGEKPDSLIDAVNAVMQFYRCGRTDDRCRECLNGNVAIRKRPILDYYVDAPMIYAAFLSQYNVDLNKIEYLHWWAFRAMFEGLESHVKIVEIMGYRAVDISKIKNKAERNRIAKLQEIYALPDTRTLEEKVAAAGAAFGGGIFD